jgi:aspartate dehydrogenase
MGRIGVIGHGAIARYLQQALMARGLAIQVVIARPGRGAAARAALGATIEVVQDFAAIFPAPDLIVDCAGHAGLRQHGPAILRAGVPLITVAAGALADEEFAARIRATAMVGNTRLHLASGAIGALDALASAQCGGLGSVLYTGRKPPAGWRGSRAETVLDLDALHDLPATHFRGSARDAALLYPKNANVAAAVALAGIGFDATRVELIADPAIAANTHEIHAEGDFGAFSFTIQGNTLPGNPRTSALAAMSVVHRVLTRAARIVV